MYQGNPNQLETQKAKFVEILDKWEKKKAGTYRYDIVIEGDKLYITVIETKLGKEQKEKDVTIKERDTKIKELEEDVEKSKEEKKGKDLDKYIESQDG